jgi:hypothetical protein
MRGVCGIGGTLLLVQSIRRSENVSKLLYFCVLTEDSTWAHQMCVY